MFILLYKWCTVTQTSNFTAYFSKINFCVILPLFFLIFQVFCFQEVFLSKFCNHSSSVIFFVCIQPIIVSKFCITNITGYLYSSWIGMFCNTRNASLTSYRHPNVSLGSLFFGICNCVWVRLWLYSVGDRWMNEFEALVEWYWQGRAEVLWEKPAPVPLCPPQIAGGTIWPRTRSSAVTCRRLTDWPMPRPHL
jgi:hypothetical protein